MGKDPKDMLLNIVQNKHEAPNTTKTERIGKVENRIKFSRAQTIALTPNSRILLGKCTPILSITSTTSLTLLYYSSVGNNKNNSEKKYNRERDPGSYQEFSLGKIGG